MKNWLQSNLVGEKKANIIKWSSSWFYNTRTAFFLTLSILSGRLVAAKIVTSFNCSMPSISVKSWARTRSATFPAPEELIFKNMVLKLFTYPQVPYYF